jgi:hypothetical protein
MIIKLMHLRAIRRVCGIFIVFLALSHGLKAYPNGAISKKCSPLIISASGTSADQEVSLLKNFSRYSYTMLPNSAGFALRLKGEKQRNTRTLLVQSPRRFKTIPKRELWDFEGRQYEFVDTGFKNLEEYADRVNQLVISHILLHPDQDLVIRYDGQRIGMGDILHTYRWTIHTAVIQKYEEVKKYLERGAFSKLQDLNLRSSNNDVFALMIPEHDLDLNPTSIRKRLQLTIQITYPGDKTFFRPNLKDLLDSVSVEGSTLRDFLPFEYRIPDDLREGYHKAIFSVFDPSVTCEFTRYATFNSRLPQAVKDRFLFDAFQTAISRGMKNVVISVDKATGRLFRRYGFRKLMVLPTDQDEEEEYLYFLQVDTPFFAEIFEKLFLSGEPVEVVED